jgi:hypothetical protein
MESSVGGELSNQSFSLPDLAGMGPAFQKFKVPPGGANPQFLQSWLLRLQMSLTKSTTAKVGQSKPPSPSKPPKNQSTLITLVRPQGITLPPPPPKPKKIKKKSNFTYDSPLLKRSRSAMLPPPRDIHTPDWTEPLYADYIPTPVGPFDLVEAHKGLEICESRIQRGEDTEHQHPALAPIVSQSLGSLELTCEEIEMTSRYDCAAVVQPLPVFWPERVWDVGSSRLSVEDSDRLKAQIEESTIEGREGWQPRIRSPVHGAKVKRIVFRRPLRSKDLDSAVIRICMDDLETDSNETDMEDF